MTLYLLPPEPVFPDPREADPDGLLAVGGDLSLQRLISAYRQGIFPWYEEGMPILWWCPHPRLVLDPPRIKCSRRLKRIIRQERFEIALDTDFVAVIENCARVERRQGPGTWITEEMKHAYVNLFHVGFAHSVEVRTDGDLVGGLYGIALGKAFFGESMFYKESNASKVALVYLAALLAHWEFDFIDCQQSTAHLKSMGARDISRNYFLDRLEKAAAKPGIMGKWSFPEGFSPLELLEK